MSVLSRYTRYKNVYMADGPVWVQPARQYRQLLPSSAGTSIVFGGRPSTTATSMRWPASGPRWRTAVIVGAVSVSEVPIFARYSMPRRRVHSAPPAPAFGRMATDAGGWRAHLRSGQAPQFAPASPSVISRPGSPAPWQAGITSPHLLAFLRPRTTSFGDSPRIRTESTGCHAKRAEASNSPASAFVNWPASHEGDWGSRGDERRQRP